MSVRKKLITNIRVNPQVSLAAPPEPEDISFEEPYKVLTGNAYALWIRLHAIPQGQLNEGRRALARRVGLPPRTFDRHISELRNHGFVGVVTQRAPGHSAIQLLKRAAIIGATHVVTIHRTTNDPLWDYGFPGSGRTAEEILADRRRRAVKWRPKGKPAVTKQNDTLAQVEECLTPCPDRGDAPQIQAGSYNTRVRNKQRSPQSRRATSGESTQTERATSGESTQTERAANGKITQTEQAINGELAQLRRATNGKNAQTEPAISGKKPRVLTLDERAKKWADSQASKCYKTETDAEGGSSLLLRSSVNKKFKSKDFKEELPDVSRDPKVRLRRAEELFTGKRAEEYKRVIEGEGDTREEKAARKRAEAEIGAAFLEVYVALRRAKVQPGYRPPRVNLQAIRAGTGCLLSDMKPRDAINYWAERVRDFTSMVFPSLSFMASERNLDEASLATMPRPSKSKSKNKEDTPRSKNMRNRIGIKTDEFHAFTEDKLIPGLEPYLIDSGVLKKGELTIRDLLVVQSKARGIKLGVGRQYKKDPVVAEALKFFEEE